MLKDLIWETFEKTGEVNVYLLLKEMESNRQCSIEKLTKDEVAISKIKDNIYGVL